MQVNAIRAGGTVLYDDAFSWLNRRAGFIAHWALLLFLGFVAFVAKFTFAPWANIPLQV